MFVDASASMAIVAGEPGHSALMDRLRDSPVRLTSGVAVYEAVLAITRLQAVSPEVRDLHRRVKRALDPRGILNPGKFV